MKWGGWPVFLVLAGAQAWSQGEIVVECGSSLTVSTGAVLHVSGDLRVSGDLHVGGRLEIGGDLHAPRARFAAGSEACFEGDRIHRLSGPEPSKISTSGWLVQGDRILRAGPRVPEARRSAIAGSAAFAMSAVQAEHLFASELQPLVAAGTPYASPSAGNSGPTIRHPYARPPPDPAA